MLRAEAAGAGEGEVFGLFDGGQPAELRVEGSRDPLRRLRAPGAILPGDRVECATARSGRLAAVVASDVRSLRIRLDRVVYRVRNLFLLDARPQPGDSGGLVFDAAGPIANVMGSAGILALAGVAAIVAGRAIPRQA